MDVFTNSGAISYAILALEALIVIGLGIFMQALSVKRVILRKVGRKPTIGYALLFLVFWRYIPALPTSFEDGYLISVLMQVGAVTVAVFLAALLSIGSLLFLSILTSRLGLK